MSATSPRERAVFFTGHPFISHPATRRLKKARAPCGPQDDDLQGDDLNVAMDLRGLLCKTCHCPMPESFRQNQLARIRIHAPAAYLRYQLFEHRPAHVGL